MVDPGAGVPCHPPPADPSFPSSRLPPPLQHSQNALNLQSNITHPLQGSSGRGSSQTRAQPRHKVVFDLHLQHLALYDQPEGHRPLQPPLLWQASGARGSLKFRLRTRSPPSVCLLLDDSSHEMLIPLSYVTSLRILPSSSDNQVEGVQSAAISTGAASSEAETEAETERRLRTTGLVLELGIMKGSKKDFRLRQPNSYVRLTPEAPLGMPERGGETDAIDFTGGAARLVNLIRLTIHASVTTELSHSMTSIVVRALRVRDGQLPQPSATDDTPAARASLKALEGDLSIEGYLKRGWRWPKYSTPDDGPLEAGVPQLTRQAVELDDATAEIVRSRPRVSPQMACQAGACLPSSISIAGEGLVPPRPPATPMPAGLLPLDLLVDESSPESSHAEWSSLSIPPQGNGGEEDLERTPVNRQFDPIAQLRHAYRSRHPSACPPLCPSTPLQTLSTLGTPPLMPSLLPTSHGRSLSLGLNVAPLPPLASPSSSHYRSSSYDSTAAIVPDSYWEPRTRRSSVSSSAAWSDSTGASEASLSSADVGYLLDLAAASPAHEYWAPIFDKGSGENERPVAGPGSSSGRYDDSSSSLNAGESRPSSGNWSLGLSDSLQCHSLGPSAEQPEMHRHNPSMPLDVGPYPVGSMQSQQAHVRTRTFGPEGFDDRHLRQKSVPLPPPPSAVLRSPLNDPNGAPVLPFYPVLSSSRNW